MKHTNNITLYLSKNKEYLMDINGAVISHRTENEDKIFYASIGIESEAFKKKCIAFKAVKVCTSWDADNVCLIWDEVDVCVQWQYQPEGFNNIS